MRLLIQHPHRPDDISGVLTYVDLISEALRELPGVDVEVVASPSTRFQAKVRAVMRADVVHLNSNDLSLALLAKVSRRRLVMKMHYLPFQSVHWTYEPMSFARRLRTEVRTVAGNAGLSSRYFWETLARLALRLFVLAIADVRLACSTFTAEATSFPRPIHTALYPVRAAMVPPDMPDFGLSGLPRAVFVGRLVEDKGVDVLLDAVHLALESGSRQFVVDIVGDGQCREALEAAARAMGLSDCVVFHGRLPHEAIGKLIRASRLVVQPARWQEPAGYTPLEAAALARASAVSRVGGLREVAGPHAWTFPAEDSGALAAVLTEVMSDDGTLAETRGRACWQRARTDFSPVRAARELLEHCTP